MSTISGDGKSSSVLTDGKQDGAGLSDQESVYQGLDDDNAEVRQLAKTFTRESAYSRARKSTSSSNKFPPPTAESDGAHHTVDETLDPRLDPESDEFEAKFWIQNLKNLYDSDPDYYRQAKLGVAYRDLRAYGLANDIDYQATVGNAVWKLGAEGIRWMRGAKPSDYFDILKPMDAIMKPGELTAVLGRPGSGCSTLLKTVAVNTYGFHIGKESKITYDGLSSEDITKNFRGEVIYSAETDVHFPHLLVGDTLEIAAALRTPHNRAPGVDREAYAKHLASAYMAMYGLSHTRHTKVGNDFVRGVSGGERKRVSIAEVSLSRANIQCWDNATRGLDAATALEFIRALKTSATVLETTPVIAIYQCSKDAYDLFNKVCVLYDGYQIYFGPADKAREYFVDMGYECVERQTTADFLTAVTNPAERVVRAGFEHKVPKSAVEFEAYWKRSAEYAALVAEIDQHFIDCEKMKTKQLFHDSHSAKQANRMKSSSSYTVSFPMQIKYVMRRNLLLLKGDPSIVIAATVIQLVMALVLSSIFYNQDETTTSLYYRGAALFFAVLFNSLNCLLEIMALFDARPVVEKHRKYAFYRPAADALASIITELPTKFLMSMVFNLAYYFMVNFRREPGRFFFFLLTNAWATLVMSHLFRSLGAMCRTLAGAMTPAVLLLLSMVIYTGFVLPTTMMLGWARWIIYVNPMAYVFESLMCNEFHDREFLCSTFIPSGPGYEDASDANRVCTTMGSRSGSLIVNGSDYIQLLYGYDNSHRWRNFGIIVALTFFFLLTYVLLTEFNKGARQRGEIALFLKSALKNHRKQMSKDEESGAGETSEKLDVQAKGEADRFENSKESLSSRESDSSQEKSKDVFFWKNLTYQVKIKKEDRVILNHVDGWVKPGQITALMGASGAGKTTLLNCLSERVTTGVITDGERMVNGHSLDSSFQRSIGYVQQQDLHLSASTVREALQFSAYLRQSNSVSKKEKDEYVDYIIDLLEMTAYADALVGVAGEGLNVEQRKRLTIGVELVAKPKLLLFLDEPTSGLDSQTAWSICKLMRKLADHGQAILCTIHQPSAILMQEFDRLLFLQKGGETVYFGDLGKGCCKLIDYFESHGADPCPPDANPAEWMLHVVGAAPGSHAKADYFEVWRNSQEYQEMRLELASMETELSKLPRDTDPEIRLKFAAPIWKQYLLVSWRAIIHKWRTPEYIYSKMLLVITAALFNGFSFFKAGTSLQGLQNQMFSVFMFFVPFNTMIQQMYPYYVKDREVYETREAPSRTFGWFSFITAQITSEIPYQIVGGTFSFLCWYYPVGLYNNAAVTDTVASRGVLMWLFITSFMVLTSTIGHLTISFNEQEMSAANLASMFFMMCLNFCGVLAPRDALPKFWLFMYYVSPFTYLIQGMLSNGLANNVVVCKPSELVAIVPPEGVSCESYMQPFISNFGGYVDASSNSCHYCQMSSTNVFLAGINAMYSERWRNYGIVISFILINIMLATVFYFLARVPKGNREKKSKEKSS
ncbi:uncharacterized protein LODBEIA_P33060 [Lodderomyces beijingensis]|uniref:ABC transporter domain-containing protein n=1 Tax=Lodderomyces beijingensis TaxID=1775926 RepID=A0ABP0ZP13_9ASCO